MKLILGSGRSRFAAAVDPRVRLGWAISAVAAGVYVHELLPRMVLLAAVLAASLITRTSIKPMVLLIKVTAFLGVQFILLQSLLRPEGVVLMRIGALTFREGGLWEGVNGMLLLILTMTACLQFLQWTNPEELAVLLCRLGIPHRYALLPGLALRFLSVAERDLVGVMESRQCRGLELASGWRKAMNLPFLIVPLLLRTLKRAEEVSLAMELKGYGLHDQRTLVRDLRFTRRDAAIAAACGAWFVLLLVWSSMR